MPSDFTVCIRLPGKVILHNVRTLIDIVYEVASEMPDKAWIKLVNPIGAKIMKSLEASGQPLEYMIDNLLKQLNKLVYHKVYGFMEPDMIALNTSLVSLFKHTCSSITIGIDTCCICYEECNNKTPCGHDVCMPCLSSIKLHSKNSEDDDDTEDDDDDDDDIYQGKNYQFVLCPMCRHVLPVLPFKFVTNGSTVL
jgi:hypothetical protein